MTFRLLVILLFFSLLSCKTNIQSEDSYTIYLVRHAEKVADKSRDPILTHEGIERADRLAQIMSKNDIDAIYSTDYQRTMLTALPLSTKIDKDIQLYDPRNLAALSTLLKSQRVNVLVVGHSNTTPALANLILGDEFYENFKEDQYDQIIQINCSESRCNQEVLLF